MKRELTWWSKKRSKELTWKIFVYILLGGGSIIFLIPLFWMFSTALKEETQVFAYPPQWIPSPAVWENFPRALTSVPFIIFYKNSFVISASCILGAILTAPLVAYGFARLRFPGRGLLFLILLSSMMLPYHVTLIPLFIIYRYLGWIDTFKPLIIPFFFGGAPFFIFLLRQYYMTIPLELDDAARIDGCSEFGIYSRIMLPLSKPVLMVVVIFTFMWNWNDFLGPLIYLRGIEKMTVALGLNFFQSTRYGTKMTLLMAASFTAIIPCMLLFFFGQKYFLRGITLTGSKG